MEHIYSFKKLKIIIPCDSILQSSDHVPNALIRQPPFSFLQGSRYNIM
jgi:hypothetical protein